MHTSRRSSSPLARMAPWVSLAALTVSLLGGAGSAQAGQGVHWAVNVEAPLQGFGRVGTTFSSSPRGLYGHAPVVIAPPVVYVPQPVYVQRGHGHGRYAPRWGWGHQHRDHGHHGWRDGRHDGRYDGYHGGGHRQSWRDDRRDGRYDGRYEGRHEGRRYAWGDND